MCFSCSMMNRSPGTPCRARAQRRGMRTVSPRLTPLQNRSSRVRVRGLNGRPTILPTRSKRCPEASSNASVIIFAIDERPHHHLAESLQHVGHRQAGPEDGRQRRRGLQALTMPALPVQQDDLRRRARRARQDDDEKIRAPGCRVRPCRSSTTSAPATCPPAWSGLARLARRPASAIFARKARSSPNHGSVIMSAMTCACASNTGTSARTSAGTHRARRHGAVSALPEERAPHGVFGEDRAGAPVVFPLSDEHVIVGTRRWARAENSANLGTEADDDRVASAHLTSDAAVCGGQLCAKGTRVLVTMILDSLAEGHGREEILRSYPSLAPVHTNAALA